MVRRSLSWILAFGGMLLVDLAIWDLKVYGRQLLDECRISFTKSKLWLLVLGHLDGLWLGANWF